MPNGARHNARDRARVFLGDPAERRAFLLDELRAARYELIQAERVASYPDRPLVALREHQAIQREAWENWQQAVRDWNLNRR